MLTSIFIIGRGKVPLHEEWRKGEEAGVAGSWGKTWDYIAIVGWQKGI